MMTLTKIQRRMLARLAGIVDAQMWESAKSLGDALPSKPRSRSLVMNTLERRQLVAQKWDSIERQYFYRITDAGLEAIGQEALKLEPR